MSFGLPPAHGLLDPLTGLLGRYAFLEALRRLLPPPLRECGVGVFSIDLGGFKSVNDHYGHRAGDLLLRHAADRLRRAMPPGGVLGRTSGGAFALALPLTSPSEEAPAVAELIRACFVDAFRLDDVSLSVGCRIGICIYPQDATSADELFHRSEITRHTVKREGGSTAFFEPRMFRRLGDRLAVESRLREALAAGEFEVHYQPKMRLSNGSIAGAEALLRWRHPELGLIGPDRVIPVAERSDLIFRIEDWVMRTVCSDLRELGDYLPADFRIAVNLSARQFMRADLVGNITARAASEGVSPTNIEVEITESVAMQDAELSASLFGELKQSGISIAIDDFGTGYSSLAYLRRFPFDAIKIDRSFVDEITTNREDQAISHSIISLAKSIGIATVAEGVETAEQAELLAAHGCDSIQGYWVARPQPKSVFVPFLRERCA